MTPATAVPVSEVPNSTAPHPPGPTRAQREKRFRTQKRQQQNENKHISRRKHARRRRGKHGGQGGGESRHCTRVRETRQVRIVGSQELSPETCKKKQGTCAPPPPPHISSARFCDFLAAHPIPTPLTIAPVLSRLRCPPRPPRPLRSRFELFAAIFEA